MATRSEIFEHFRAQADACERLGSPFTARVCRAAPGALGPETSFGRRVLGWPGDPREDALALRVAGALHALARSGRAPGLRRAWPPGEAADVGDAIASAVAAHDAWLAPWLDSAPQTNETGRSAILLGGCLEVARRTGLALEILEIGASAGLNLHFDAWAYDLGAAGAWGGPSAPLRIACDWRGRTPDLATPLAIAARAGVDRAPLDPAEPADRARMLAYIWADQPSRLARAEAALAHAADAGIRLARADAADWTEARLARAPRPGRARVLLHTIVWQYLGAARQARIRTALEDAGSRATTEAPLAWLRLEPDADAASAAAGAAITLTLWPGGEERRLGRGDFHGSWADWTCR